MTAFVVTGTDTGIGKTVFAAALTRAIAAHYWKPVQSGLEDGADADTVANLAGVPRNRIVPEAYRLTQPLSPHRAAELDGLVIDPAQLALPPQRPLVVEGAGGVLVPITRGTTYADVFAWWNLPVIVVARTSLGTINHSLLTFEALRARGVTVHGVAFVGEANPDNEDTIATMGGVRRLGRLPMLPVLDADHLTAAFVAGFDMKAFG
jgi:dethiobiotin synthetase